MNEQYLYVLLVVKLVSTFMTIYYSLLKHSFYYLMLIDDRKSVLIGYFSEL